MNKTRLSKGYLVHSLIAGGFILSSNAYLTKRRYSMKKAITIYQRPNTRGQKQGAKGFDKEFDVTHGDTATLALAVEFDNTPGKNKDGYRKGSNFISANWILQDIDNTYSDNPADWITPEHVVKALEGIMMYYYPSRNHMKEKDGKTPRPKFHII